MSVIWLDCRPGGAWASGHLAGALDADVDRYLSTAADPGFDPALGGRHPLPPLDRWSKQLGLWGIGPETMVVAYDGARGALGACRLWWMLRASGHHRISVIEESLADLQAGTVRPWVTDPTPAPTPVDPYPVTAWTWPTTDLEGASRFASHPELLLIDVRAPERWRGEAEPLDPVAGRIPGSVNVPLAWHHADDGTWLGPGALRSLYLPLFGGRPTHNVAVHCGSGVSACATLYALHKAGLDGAALYVGSYSQWCRSGRTIGRGPG